LFVLVGVVFPLCAEDQKPKKQDKDQQTDFAQLQALLDEPLADVKDLVEKKTSLVKFLQALEGQIPKDKKVTLRLDKEALGKDFDKVADAPVELKSLPAKASLRLILRKAFAQAPVRLEYALRPAGIVVTHPRLAAHAATYPVDDLVKVLPSLMPLLKRQEGHLFPRGHLRGVKATDGEALLSRVLSGGVKLESFESFEFVNGTSLVAVALADTHREIESLLGALRGWADLAVIINARLYEIDSAVYVKHVVPLLKKEEDADERPTVVPLDQKVFKAVIKGKELVRSDEVKLLPNRGARFLSKQAAYRYVSERGEKKGDEVTSSGLSGVTFAVRPAVSPDRRYLRLEITQEVTQLVKIDKVQKIDLYSGKAVEIESPNLRRVTLSGSVQLPDYGALLMPVDYKPAAKDKVWVLVARPFIWIEEEVLELRLSGKAPSSRDVFESDVPVADEEVVAVPQRRLPGDDTTTQILRAVIDHVLTSPELKSQRAFYGTPKDKTFSLVDGDKLGWPAEFVPRTHGHRLMKAKPDSFGNRRLGIRLDKFDLKQKEAKLEDAPIEVCLFNAGGTGNGGVIGGCTVYYLPRRVGKRWTVECQGTIDP
jgi:hypothetical protein